MNGKAVRSVSGIIAELDVSGFGPNSAQLEFAITPAGKPSETYVVNFDAEPQVFASIATILSGAYQARTAVTVFIPSGQKPGETERISGVKVPV